MKTLKEIIIDQKLRKGPSHGMTKNGAFWTFNPTQYFSVLRRSGGDGIGNSSPDITFFLEFRHFRSGEVRAEIIRKSWHQNDGERISYTNGNAVLDAQTVEDVIVALKGIKTSEGESIVSSNKEEGITEDFVALGMPIALPAPDEIMV